jgi:HSP20 family molecular chaperone IbpA
MKKWLLSTLAIAVVATSVSAEEIKQPYNKLKKQIDIMSNIISSSLTQTQGRKRNRDNLDVDGVYLKSQGIVFEISHGRGMSRLFRKFGNDSDFSISFDGIPPIAAVAPIVISDGDQEQFIEMQVEHAAEVYEDVMEAFRERSDHARGLREEQRELAYETRNYARRQRDLEFEVRHADDRRKKELKEELAELASEVAKLEAKELELSVRAEKEEKSLKDKKRKQAEKVKKVKSKYYAKLDSAIAETLCDYGAGLRQLSKNEHVTFIIDMDSNNDDVQMKKIHTFSKKDIVSCVMEDKTPAQLLKAANSYYF